MVEMSNEDNSQEDKSFLSQPLQEGESPQQRRTKLVSLNEVTSEVTPKVNNEKAGKKKNLVISHDSYKSMNSIVSNTPHLVSNYQNQASFLKSLDLQNSGDIKALHDLQMSDMTTFISNQFEQYIQNIKQICFDKEEDLFNSLYNFKHFHDYLLD